MCAAPVLQDTKKTVLFTSNAIDFQSVWSSSMKCFVHVLLLVKGKILRLKIPNKKTIIIFARWDRNRRIGVFLVKHSHGFLGVNRHGNGSLLKIRSHVDIMH